MAAICGFAVNTYASGFDLNVAKQRCGADNSSSPILYSSDLQWGVTRQEMTDKFLWVYESGKRLPRHSTYDASQDQFYIYYKSYGDGLSKVKINELFIKSVTQQLESALQAGYAEFVFFSDMGHSHLYFPQTHWDQEYRDMATISAEERVAFYEKAFADPKLRPLYHTCEQLKMTENNKVIVDEYLDFRFHHRNVLGKNDGSGELDIKMAPDSSGNAVSSLPHMHVYSAGFSVSASKDGCFPYQTPTGETLYFDISLADLEMDPSLGGGADF